MGLLDGEVAIVTGAGNGIGRATALLFAREGARVVVNDPGGARDGTGQSTATADAVVKEIRERGGVAVASYEGVDTFGGATAIVDLATREFGRVDVLINNAGILRDETIAKMDEPAWDAVVRVHLKGSFACLKAAAAAMRAGGAGGRIVNTTSVSGLVGNFGQANTSAAKAGIYGLTRTASIELQRHGIRVNSVAPIAKTRMTEDLPMFDGVETMTPEHVAPAHLFLASDLSGDLTGHVLAVAGAKMSVYRLVESAGRFKEADDGVWTAAEIAEHWGSIAKI